MISISNIFGWLSPVFGLLLSTSSWGADYFVRATGDDSAIGTSKTAAWKSVGRANQASLRAGDRLLFESGCSFSGNLHLRADEGGTDSEPVTIGSFGPGRATILAGQTIGITLESAGGVIVRDLVVSGDGRTNNNGCGILCDNRLTTGQRLSHLQIEDSDISGFGVFGILISGNVAGYEHVVVRGCVLHDNLRGGMEIAGRLPIDATNYAHADVIVTDCMAWGNTGDPNYLKNHSGSGIVLYQVDGGLMDRCVAWNNGAQCRNKGGGGVGLWTCASRDVVIQHCESFANQTSGADGGGFDIDGGCIRCVLQYNYSHDNAGPGLMVYTYAYAAYSDRDNIVRFNVAENDSRNSRHYAGLYVNSYGPRMTGLRIYNNTIITGSWTDQAAAVHGEGVEATFRNNIFLAGQKAVPLRVFNPHEQLRFESNLYASDGGAIEVDWGGLRFSSLVAWRQATAPGIHGSQPSGIFGLPLFNGHTSGFRPFARAGFEEIMAFRPRRASPVIDAGMNLSAGSAPQPVIEDIARRKLPNTGPWPIGALTR